MNFSSQNGVIWCILGVLKGKIKTLVKILGGRQHRTTPACQIVGGGVRDPCNPCGVDDAYAGVCRVIVISQAVGEFNEPCRSVSVA